MRLKNYILYSIIFLTGVIANAQLESGLLLGLTNATTADINATTDAAKGSLVFNTDTNQVYVFDGTSWNQMWQKTTYTGTFRISGSGTLSVSGIPFQPTSVSFVAYANVEDFNLDSDNGTRNNETGLPNAYGSMKGFARDDNGSITEQVIFNGGSGNSINDISRYASDSHSIGVRYANQNGDKLGLTTATVTAFTSTGFTLNTDNYADGVVVIYEAHR
ncbi:hypothetical protein CSC80_12690 [Maribacter sp. 6B07]|uniref:Curlin associated repeat-containing protein n=1 Tax=Maribacter dokdonensis TaxID=320912 RepID=A0ABY0U1K5_9FLAO|nr:MULTISPECIES: hypothetical protein [Maribacter]PHN92974.1 hypothetical protein CSC80_12690 [Maribacter sp. 6B07]SDR91340.1 hypothetical protein SAMN05192545_0410 [Maribacter dokdonensis]